MSTSQDQASGRLTGRVLGIDFGARRVGIALSDEGRLIAQALTTIHRARGAERAVIDSICDLIATHEVTHIVIGWPLRLNGQEGIQTQKVARFVEALEPRVSVSISKWDERLTTTSAERALREAGVKGAQQRARVDQVAAALILQSWLDASRENMEALF